MKKLITLSSFALLAVLPNACCYFDGCCGGDVPSFSTITDLQLITGSFTPDAGLSQTMTTDFNLAALVVSIEDFSYSDEMAHAPTQGFIASAYACSPPLPTPTQKLESISITAADELQLGGQTLPAGAPLQDFFLASKTYSNAWTVADFITEQGNDPWLFGGYHEQVAFQLAAAPDVPFESVFTIVIRFDDDSEFTLTSEAWAID